MACSVSSRQRATRPLATWLLLVPALDARLLEQLAVLLLGHALTTLLDDRAHQATTLLAFSAQRLTGTPSRSPGWEAGHTPEARQLDRLRARQPPTQSTSLPAISDRFYRRAAIGRSGPRNTCLRMPRRFRSPAACNRRTCSAGADESSAQVLIDRLFRYPERATDPYRLQFARVHQPIDGHL